MSGDPLIKPPYAHLTAIDLNKGEIAWKVPVGEGSRAVRSHPLLKDVPVPDRLGSPASGGAILTGGGLIFIGGGDGYLYAFDRNDGRELWRGRLPYVNGENTMTYRMRAGRQFVLVSTGSGVDASLVAFALPDGSGATASRPVADSGQRRAASPRSRAQIQGRLAFDRVCQTCHGSGAEAARARARAVLADTTSFSASCAKARARCRRSRRASCRTKRGPGACVPEVAVALTATRRDTEAGGRALCGGLVSH